MVVCRLCKPLKQAGSDEAATLVRKETCLPVLGLCLAGGGGHVRLVHPASRATTGSSGLVLREFFAGHGVITKAWLAEGAVALEPVELYEDPHRQIGPRPDHDLSKPEVQAKYKEEVQQNESNVHWISYPCTTFCDWQLQNQGTRTFECPAGQPTAKEENGNTLSNYGADLFEASMMAGNFPVAESSGTSGRYPKQWNLASWKRIIQRPDVDFIELDMCAFGLGPPDTVGEFYKHRTGLVFPHHPPLRQALLRLCPGISAEHKHIGLKGARPGRDVTRCTEAGVYAPRFVAAVVQTLLETLQVEGVRPRVGGGLCHGLSLPPQSDPHHSTSGSMSSPTTLASSGSTSRATTLASSGSTSSPTTWAPLGSTSSPTTLASSGATSGSISSRTTLASSRPASEPTASKATLAKTSSIDRDGEHGSGKAGGEADGSEGEEEEEEMDDPLLGVWAEPRSADALTDEGGREDQREPAEGEADGWRVDTQKGLLWITHQTPRSRLFVPGGLGFPFSPERIRNERYTLCERRVDGEVVECKDIIDNWREVGATEAPIQGWTGPTLLVF